MMDDVTRARLQAEQVARMRDLWVSLRALEENAKDAWPTAKQRKLKHRRRSAEYGWLEARYGDLVADEEWQANRYRMPGWVPKQKKKRPESDDDDVGGRVVDE